MQSVCVCVCVGGGGGGQTMKPTIYLHEQQTAACVHVYVHVVKYMIVQHDITGTCTERKRRRVVQVSAASNACFPFPFRSVGHILYSEEVTFLLTTTDLRYRNAGLGLKVEVKGEVEV